MDSNILSRSADKLQPGIADNNKGTEDNAGSCDRLMDSLNAALDDDDIGLMPPPLLALFPLLPLLPVRPLLFAALLLLTCWRW